MLEPYKITPYYRLGDGEWLRCNGSGVALLDADTLPEELVFLDHASWDQVRDGYAKFDFKAFDFGTTFFRQREYLELRVPFPEDPVRLYKEKFPVFSYKHVYSLDKDCSVGWLLDNAPAADVLQYLKDHGLSVGVV